MLEIKNPGAFRALMKNESRRRQDIEDERRGVVRPPRRQCPIILTDLERKLYTHCANCHVRVERHR